MVRLTDGPKAMVDEKRGSPGCALADRQERPPRPAWGKHPMAKRRAMGAILIPRVRTAVLQTGF